MFLHSNAHSCNAFLHALLVKHDTSHCMIQNCSSHQLLPVAVQCRSIAKHGENQGFCDLDNASSSAATHWDLFHTQAKDIRMSSWKEIYNFINPHFVVWSSRINFYLVQSSWIYVWIESHVLTCFTCISSHPNVHRNAKKLRFHSCFPVSLSSQGGSQAFIW